MKIAVIVVGIFVPSLGLAQGQALLENQDESTSAYTTNLQNPANKVSIADIETKLMILQSQSGTEVGDTLQFATFETLDKSKNTTDVALLDAKNPPIGLENVAAVTRFIENLDAMSNAQDTQPDDTPLTHTNDLVATFKDSDEVKKTPSPLKRVYNRLFQDGGSNERLSATVFLANASVSDGGIQQENQADDGVLVAIDDKAWQYENEFLATLEDAEKNIKLVKTDPSQEPFKNIKAALENVSVDSVGSFSVALPRLKETVESAARAVGYYDTKFFLKNAGNGNIDVVIYELGEPVKIDYYTLEVRGETEGVTEIETIKQDSQNELNQPFNHGNYEETKAKISQLRTQKGFFDGRWLDSSADVILPDNSADVSLVYDAGVRYGFDEVVFVTIDEETGELTSDPNKLPVRLPLLQKLVNFEPNDGFDQAKVGQLSADLQATRYFNNATVETVLPEPNPPKPTEEPAPTLVFEDSETSEEVQAQIAPIDFSASEDLLAKLTQVTNKADRLYNSPDDRVLDPKTKKSTSLLGRVSDVVTSIVKVALPDESGDELPALPEGVEPPTLANKKTPKQVFEDKKVPLYVFVVSDKPRDAKIGLGWGSDTGARLTASLEDGLVNNGGYQAGIGVSLSEKEKGANAYLARPLSHPLNDKLTTSVKYYKEEIAQTLPNVELNAKTLEAGLTRSIIKERGWNMTYGVRYRLDELESNAPRHTWVDLPVRFDEGRPSQEAILAGITLSKFKQDNSALPTKGYRQSYSLEAGSKSLGSSTDMAILKASLGGMISFGDNQYGNNRKHQLVGRVEGGYLWAENLFDVPYKLRFFAGGDQSLRGYDYQSLSPISPKGYLAGGQALAIGSLEYSYEVKEGLRGAVFADVGGAYNKDFKNDTKLGVGVGVRYASPVGTVRVDIAKGIEKESTPIRLHFLIGLPF